MNIIPVFRCSSLFQAAACLLFLMASLSAHGEQKRLAYLVSDVRIPFWNIMASGIRHEAAELGYSVSVYSADNSARTELEAVADALASGIDGLILSPTNSSAAVTVLKLASQADVPVVVADIGADSGQYLSYIKSDNYQGAYDLGQILATALKARGWQDGRVGIVAIPQKRANGKARTEGFLQALDERGIDVAGLYQQADFSYRETYDYTRRLMADNPNLRAVWLQGSDRYQAALDAIDDAGKTGEILLICFDAEPEFLEMIAMGELVGAGMQQPFLMGEKAVDTLDLHLNGHEVPPVQEVAVLAVSHRNLDQWLPLILRNVLGND